MNVFHKMFPRLACLAMFGKHYGETMFPQQEQHDPLGQLPGAQEFVACGL